MMRYGSVYVITNKHTGEQYVGQTRRLVSKRWDSHWRTAICEKSRKAKFQKVLLEHGKDAFTVEEIYVSFDAEDLNAAEIRIIAELNPVYNSSRGGRGLRPIIVSEETKKKRSEAAKARWADPEWKAKTVVSIKAAHNSEEARARGAALAAIYSGKNRWVGYVKPIKPVKNKSEALKKSWADESIRAKRLAGIKKYNATPEGKIARSRASTGRIMSNEVVQKVASAKWKPVFCPELQTSFLCQKYAAEVLGVKNNTVSNAISKRGKVLKKYTLVRVA